MGSYCRTAGAQTVIGLVVPVLSLPDVASMLPNWPAVAIERPLKVATPFIACTVVVKPESPGSAIVTSPLKLVSTLWYGSSADTTTVKSWPAMSGLGGGVVTTRLVAAPAIAVTVSVPTTLEAAESVAVMVCAPAVFKTTPVKVYVAGIGRRESMAGRQAARLGVGARQCRPCPVRIWSAAHDITERVFGRDGHCSHRAGHVGTAKLVVTTKSLNAAGTTLTCRGRGERADPGRSP